MAQANRSIFSLEGKVAVVTGGNGGIGFALAKGLLQNGAKVAIVGRNQEKTDQAAVELEKYRDAGVMGLTADLIEEPAIMGMVDAVCDKFGRLDILVNNAGINLRKRPEEYSVEEWDDIIRVNLRTPFLCAQKAHPAMKEAGGGKIINIGSMTSIFGGTLLTPYGTSKGGIVSMTKSLAVAWARDNIQVNAILPGWINTPLAEKARRDIKGLNENVMARTPAERWGETQDLVGATVFYSSQASDFVTGTALPVDGGYSTKMI
jgi:2-deoxy-D-gluconate 3-dehydrogenase